jgi:hypothetical protein
MDKVNNDSRWIVKRPASRRDPADEKERIFFPVEWCLLCSQLVEIQKVNPILGSQETTISRIFFRMLHQSLPLHAVAFTTLANIRHNELRCLALRFHNIRTHRHPLICYPHLIHNVETSPMRRLPYIYLSLYEPLHILCLFLSACTFDNKS